MGAGKPDPKSLDVIEKRKAYLMAKKLHSVSMGSFILRSIVVGLLLAFASALGVVGFPYKLKPETVATSSPGGEDKKVEILPIASIKPRQIIKKMFLKRSLEDQRRVEQNFRLANERYREIIERFQYNEEPLARQLDFCKELEAKLSRKLKAKELLLEGLRPRVSESFEQVKDSLEKFDQSEYEREAYALYLRYQAISEKTDREIAETREDITKIRKRIEELEAKLKLVRAKKSLTAKREELLPFFR